MGKHSMILLDLFSGIGGFSKGFQDAGWKFDKHYYSDIDKHANAVYKYHYPEAINVGDVRTIQGIERPNIITFGSPCQDFSLAGKRKGLDGDRSSLVGSAITLIEKYKPDIFIWENVKGVFSSNNGADFWAVIQAFANIGGYRLEWQLLNTTWFLPQNRERIYLIGHLGKGSGRKVFPIGESNQLCNGTQGTPGDERNGIRSGHSERKSNINSPKDRRCGEGYANKGIKIGNIYPSKSENGNVYSENGISPTLKSGETSTKGNGGIGSCNSPKIVIQQLPRGHNKGGEHDIPPTLSSNSFDRNNFVKEMKVCNCVTPDAYITDGKRKRDKNGKAVLTSMHERRIRRLTPIECERLQGFSDNWTSIGNYDGEIKEISDTQRYKMCGNAVSIPPVKKIAKRLR